MKKVLSALAFLAFVLLSTTTLKAIDFEQQASWEQILEKAKKTGQVIFVDAYATWCGPCKMLDKEVFTDSTVSAYFNAQFLCVKFDMESERGEPFGAQFEVDAFPSLFFISPDGTVLKKQVGFVQVEKLLAIGKYVVNPSDSPIDALKARYEAGERDTAFLAEYLLASAEIGEINTEAAQVFLLTSSPEKIASNFEFYALLYQTEFSLDSELGRYFSTHFAHFLGEYTSYSYQKLIEMLNGHLMQGVTLSSATYFDQAKAYVEATVKDEDVRDELLKSIEKAKKENFKKK